ncbi:hypothetical protein FOA52_013572 [Chlamydomonas sp. UWO 241]|nr:hypothetical protein FOA52_013572 [Chlamydomonas sp. UWO 241]
MAQHGAYEEDAMPHPHTAFNKQPYEAPTLVGNWQEERSLKDCTGITRYEQWTEGGATTAMEDMARTTSVYATRSDNRKDAGSFTRVLEHSEQTHPTNWASTNQTSYQDPKNKVSINAYKDVGVGPREKRMMAEMMAEASALPPVMEYKLTDRPKDQYPNYRDSPEKHFGVAPTLDSTYRALHDEKDMTGLIIGTRVIKDRDNRPAVRDPTFLAETQMCARGDVDRVLKQAAVASGATLTATLSPSATSGDEVPVTIYSEAVAKAAYSGTMTGGTRTLSKVTPFGKECNFSKTMSEHSKVVVDE